MELKAVLFDLWGTLIVDAEHRSRPRRLWRAENVRAILGRAGVALTFDTADAALNSASVALSLLHDEGIDLPPAGRVDLFLRELGEVPELSGPARDELLDAICAMHPEHRPDVAEGAVEALIAIRARGLATALVSNAGFTTASHLRAMLAGYGLAQHFDAFVFSDDFELAKPDGRLFLAALHQLGVEAPAAAFVGDSPHNDIFGARQAGLIAVQIGHREGPPRTGYTESDGARPHAYITSLSDLIPTLDELFA